MCVLAMKMGRSRLGEGGVWLTRRTFVGAAISIAAPGVALGSPSAFPGQPGNPVGHAAAPGYPGSLTPWPGGSFASGTPGNPKVYSFYDFVSGPRGVLIGSGLHDIAFVGCRFQSNSLDNYNVQVAAGDGKNVTFSYCTVAPLVSLEAQPPGGGGYATWPSGGIGQNVRGSSTLCSIVGAHSYQYSFNIFSSNVFCDHCDIWGSGNGLIVYGPADAVRIQDCWIHDCAAGDTGYHVDGIAYPNNQTPPTNVIIDHCTVASIGNTQGIGFQQPSSPYNGLAINNCYLSGFGYCCNPGTSFAGNRNVVVTNNIFGTDLPWLFGAVYGDEIASFRKASNPTNVWSGNKLKIVPGSIVSSESHPRWTRWQDGFFVWPDGSFRAMDWRG
jgi:hypothetical protein